MTLIKKTLIVISLTITASWVLYSNSPNMSVYSNETQNSQTITEKNNKKIDSIIEFYSDLKNLDSEKK